MEKKIKKKKNNHIYRVINEMGISLNWDKGLSSNDVMGPRAEGRWG